MDLDLLPTIHEKQTNTENSENLSASVAQIQIDKETFRIAWADWFENKLKQTNFNLYIALKGQEPIIKEDNSIDILLINDALNEMFTKEKLLEKLYE